MRQLITRYAGCALALGLAGCAVGPDFHRPEAPKARIEAPSLPDGDTQKIVAAMDIPGQWWTLFHCAPLDALIADALRRNADAQAAHAALQAAWENVYAQRGAYFPQANAGYNPTRQDIARDLASPAQSGASLYSLTTAQVSVSYAPDLWGGTRRQVESLVATAPQGQTLSFASRQVCRLSKASTP